MTEPTVVSRSGSADDLIRFVAGPDGSVVPDLKNSAGQEVLGQGRAPSGDRSGQAQLCAGAEGRCNAAGGSGALVDQLLTKSALGSLALARKAGAVVSGSTKVDQAIRTGTAAMVLRTRKPPPTAYASSIRLAVPWCIWRVRKSLLSLFLRGKKWIWHLGAEMWSTCSRT